ncbi:MAG: mechanosensitive ion channel [Prolixibacteraceae bacterium]|jgi:small-conductance mechanosensitive channel|nr:mechanosensitive ion channel [Prolixibacteraceae bacterium]NLO01012.1 mechanosensitive ion channel [Bacteroidales bacterium]
MEKLLSILESLLEPAGILLIIIILMTLNSRVFSKFQSASTDKNIIKKTISFFIVLFGTLALILSLPIDKSTKGQILSFLGIIITAGIALSSTNVLGNLIAGIMNNSMNRFRNGDLIKIGDLHGRVTKKSIFHTEIQLEDSNFMTLPNLYIANNPVKLTRKINTVISTTVSLGYDVSRYDIEEALKDAATETGLTDPYVYIISLGDFSVVYKIHGFLDDSNKFFSTSSQLNAKVMDKLHEKNIEIVSPTFMNQRRVENNRFIPQIKIENNGHKDELSPEDLIFDEAIKSEKIEKKKDLLKEIHNKQLSLKEKLDDLKDKTEIEKIKSTIDRNNELIKQIEKNIEESGNNNTSEKK